MSNPLRNRVLQCFKSLHKTRKSIFEGDTFALNDSRQKINEEFRKNSNIKDVKAIYELIRYGCAVEHELKTCVIQAKEISPGVYHANLSEHTVTLDNVPYTDCSNVNVKKSKPIEQIVNK